MSHGGGRVMRNLTQYAAEYLLIAAVTVTSILGFWAIYFGAGADPQPHHHVHVVTVFIWLGLLLFQLTMIGQRRFATHRKVGLVVLIIGPLLGATTAMLSVHSAHKGIVSGNGDFLIVQNVMVTMELGLLILLAFVLKKHRKLHASLLLSTTILFLGIAVFFTLISFVPQFRIEGPETFDRFQTAGMMGQAICLAVGFALFIKDVRNGWPFLLAGFFHTLNELINASLTSVNLIEPLTAIVGSLSQPYTFAATFIVLFSLLAATGLQVARRPSTT
jgi:hypothetical protein